MKTKLALLIVAVLMAACTIAPTHRHHPKWRYVGGDHGPSIHRSF